MYNCYSFLSVRWYTWWNNNFFLTKYKGCTGKYWCEVMAVWTKLNMVCTKITKGQYSPVWLKEVVYYMRLGPKTKQFIIWDLDQTCLFWICCFCELKYMANECFFGNSLHGKILTK